jgi:hypothetical protein
MFEQARRALDDSLSAELAQLGVEEAQIPSWVNLVTARLATDQRETERRANEAANARGLYGSTIRTDTLGGIGQTFGRSREDLATEAAGMFTDIARRRSGAHAGYGQRLAELLLALASEQAKNPRTPVGSGSESPGPAGPPGLPPIYDYETGLKGTPPEPGSQWETYKQATPPVVSTALDKLLESLAGNDKSKKKKKKKGKG